MSPEAICLTMGTAVTPEMLERPQEALFAEAGRSSLRLPCLFDSWSRFAFLLGDISCDYVQPRANNDIVVLLTVSQEGTVCLDCAEGLLGICSRSEMVRSLMDKKPLCWSIGSSILLSHAQNYACLFGRLCDSAFAWGYKQLGILLGSIEPGPTP